MVLRGKTVILKPIDRQNLPKTREWVSDEEIARGVLRILPVHSLNQERWFEEICSNNTKIVFSIYTTHDDVYIGNTGLYGIDYINRKCQFWIYIGEREYWGKGLGKEATSLVADYALNGLNMNKIYLIVGEDNVAAIRIYEKIGFKREGVLREEFYQQGNYIAAIRMGLLRNDFRKGN